MTTTEDEWGDLVLSTKPALLICFGPYKPSLQKGMKVEESMQAFSDSSIYSLYVSIAWSIVDSAREERNSLGVCHVVHVSCWYTWNAKALSRPNGTRSSDAVHVWLLWNWSVD